MVEIRGTRGAAAGMFGLSVVMTIVGGLLARDRHAPPTAGWVLLALGVTGSLLALRSMLSKAPLLRGTAGGISFAGRRVLPWSEIKQIYAGRMNVSFDGVRARTQSVAIDFHHKRTLFRLPFTYWIGHPFAIGDLDVAATERADVTASRLEAMRVQAVGTEDGATIGGAELPAARIVERDR